MLLPATKLRWCLDPYEHMRFLASDGWMFCASIELLQERSITWVRQYNSAIRAGLYQHVIPILTQPEGRKRLQAAYIYGCGGYAAPWYAHQLGMTVRQSSTLSLAGNMQ